GAPDLVVANFGSNNVSALLNLPPATHFLFFGSQTRFTTGTSPVAEATGDFNHDANPDLVTANRDANTVSVLLGNGNGTLQNQRSFAVDVEPSSVALGDFNGDAKQDLLITNYGSNSTSLLLGNGDGTFQAQQTTASGLSPRSVITADFNKDG